ncbi:MAG: PmoA family protein [Planctomycetota bacterium]|nr:PmoA family protein [Planctomycetota bacterium]
MKPGCFPVLSDRFRSVLWRAAVVACIPAAASLAGGGEPMLSLPGSNLPLSFHVDLPGGVEEPAGGACLIEAGESDLRPAVQLVPSVTAAGLPDPRRLALVGTIAPGSRADRRRCFRLAGGETAKPESQTAGFEFVEAGDASLRVLDDGKPVFVYNFGTMTNPAVPAADHRRSRSCYIHPVHGVDGEILTDDFPKDHYHHHGIFWTWPHVAVDGREHDLWAGDSIRQQFVRWLARRAGPVAAVLGVENGWFVGDRKVITERVWMRAYQVAGQWRALDIELFLIPNGSPVTLRGAEGKSYGGLTIRFAPQSPAVITVPSGTIQQDLTTTILRWADLTARMRGSQNRSGAAVFIAPDHPDYPPTWLLRHYGPLCVGWPGVEPQMLAADRPIRLAYRIGIHRGEASTAELARAYDAYLAGQKASWLD